MGFYENKKIKGRTRKTQSTVKESNKKNGRMKVNGTVGRK
jgi:hypothetical protein